MALQPRSRHNPYQTISYFETGFKNHGDPINTSLLINNIHSIHKERKRSKKKETTATTLE
jgi:hypothetical protein